MVKESIEEQCRYIFPSLAPIQHHYRAVLYGLQLLVDGAARTPASGITFKRPFTPCGRVTDDIFAYFVIT